ncbi:MAG: Ser-Thr-rich GPI-anchored membrane family protein, partial [Candidatus Hermodarchaeota archaeon]
EDGGAQIEAYAGEDVLLKIILKDPQNNTIKNATVTYTWAYGTGQLFDPENDGIYEVDLVNVPSGTYIIRIYAFAGDNYDFESYEIMLIVITPFTLSSNADTPDTDGSFTLTWTSSTGADNYSVYRYFSYITEINGSLTPLAEEITDLSLGLSGYSDGTYYFIVVAYNMHGENLSNCVKIDVVITKSLTIISPYASSSWEEILYIYWSSTGNISNVRIELYNNDIFVMEIVSSTPNDGEFSWFISSELVDSKNYRIKIIYLLDSSIFDYSDYFEIKNSTSPPKGIPGYHLTLLLGIISIIGVYLTRKKLLAKSR